MDVLRITFDKSIILKENLDRTTNLLLVSRSIKDCIRGLIDIDEDEYSIALPYKFPNMLEIYNTSNKKIDFFVKKFFSKGMEIYINNSSHIIEDSYVKSFIWKERLFKGYSGNRINSYKTITPIFLNELFRYEKDCSNSGFNINTLKEAASVAMINRLVNKFSCSKEEIFLNWTQFDITFAKYELESKNHLCIHGVFQANVMPPIFFGDHLVNGLGKLIVIKNDSAVLTNKNREITFYLSKNDYLALTKKAKKINLSNNDYIKLIVIENILKGKVMFSFDVEVNKFILSIDSVKIEMDADTANTLKEQIEMELKKRPLLNFDCKEEK